MTLREDKNAGMVCTGLFFHRWYFRGTGSGQVRLTRRQIERLTRAQTTGPTKVASTDRRTWWWFETVFYWEDENYEASDVLAVVRDRQRKKRRQLERAKDLLAVDEVKAPRRQPMTQEIRRAVYVRDGGHCVECGSAFELQYDHILPVAQGGATRVENLQILCGDCNRRKSDSI
jgi:hypothetical protein